MWSLKKEHIFLSLNSDTADNEETQNLFLKIVFLKISQNSQENTCVKASFLIKMQACNSFRKETPTQSFYL